MTTIARRPHLRTDTAIGFCTPRLINGGKTNDSFPPSGADFDPYCERQVWGIEDSGGWLLHAAIIALPPIPARNASLAPAALLSNRHRRPPRVERKVLMLTNMVNGAGPRS
jgi:hypothetical protein